MNIKQYAEQRGVTAQAVYQRLKKNKVKVESLTDKETGELTAEGTVILDKLYSPGNRQSKPIKDDLIEALNNQLSSLRQENVELVERVKGLEAELSTVKDERDFLRKSLENEQNNYTQILKLLPGPGQTSAGDRRKLTWRERFRGTLDSKG